MSSGSEYKCCECQELHPQQAFISHAGNDVEIAKEAARACCLAQVAPYLFEYSAEFSQPAIDNARTIANEINNSDIFLVVLSPSVSKAFWTQAWIGFEIGVSIGADIASNNDGKKDYFSSRIIVLQDIYQEIEVSVPRVDVLFLYFQPVKPPGGDHARNESATPEVRRRPGRHLRPSLGQEPGHGGQASIAEQIGEMEAYCEGKGLTITACYQEVGRGWSKKRPEFQRMLADARKGRFDTIVCWKSDRLSRGMYPAAALMEVVEAHQIRLEAVMDAIDMKTFGLMAAIGKIELDNFRERSTLGKRGTVKQGRVPTGKLPYGYRTGDDGRPEVVEEQAEAVRRIFQMYVHEGMGSYSIAVRLTDDGIPTQSGKTLWLQSRVHHILGNAAYTGAWLYGKYRHVSTEDGMKIYDQPEDTWIEIPIPQIIDDETWERAQALKKQRSRRAKRNTKVLYPLQHLLRCGECGHKQLPCQGRLDQHQRPERQEIPIRAGYPSPVLHVQRDA